jgi:hypothetical protein
MGYDVFISHVSEDKESFVRAIYTGLPIDKKNGNFLPLPEWKPGQPKPATWPSHIHPPKGCSTSDLGG